jgi:hypothetical protein
MITRISLDLAQPRTGRTTIVITLSNQQGGASGICGQAERKADREQASRNPVRSGGPIPPSTGSAISRLPAVSSRHLAGLDQRAGHAPIGAPGAAPAPHRRAPRRTTGPAPMMNWPRRELAPCLAP